jgi:hypothetical protein
MTGPVTAIIAWLLFGVYQIGHWIEDPFQGSLRLSILCDAIRRDVLGDDFSIQRDLDPRGELIPLSSVAFDPACRVLAFGCHDGRLELRTL